jgi:hypothetical protein
MAGLHGLQARHCALLPMRARPAVQPILILPAPALAPARSQKRRLGAGERWRGAALAARAGAAPPAAPAAPPSLSPSTSAGGGSIDVEHDLCVYDHAEGAFSASGRLSTAAPPAAVYAVLTDFEALPATFSSVHRVALERDAAGALTLSQALEWRLFVFSGEFVTRLRVAEAPPRALEFSLAPPTPGAAPGFVRAFVGRWEVAPAPGGGAEVRHALRVCPAAAPPRAVGKLGLKVLKAQVAGVLRDLEAELARRGAL